MALQRSHSQILQALGIEERLRRYSRAQDVLSAAVAGCDAVIHTAGKAGRLGRPGAATRPSMLTGTQHVLDACRELGIRRLVFTSSPSVAHGGGDIEGGDESLPYPASFTAPYPETKAAAEQAGDGRQPARAANRLARPHLVWGPGDNHLLPRLMERARQGPVKLPGAGKLIDTVYIENAAQAHLQALDALDGNPACHRQDLFHLQ